MKKENKKILDKSLKDLSEIEVILRHQKQIVDEQITILEEKSYDLEDSIDQIEGTKEIIENVITNYVD